MVTKYQIFIMENRCYMLTDNVRRFGASERRIPKGRLFIVHALGDRLPKLRSSWGTDLPFPGERQVGTASCFQLYRVLGSIVGMGGTSWWASASLTLLVGNVVIWGWHYNLPFSSY